MVAELNDNAEQMLIEDEVSNVNEIPTILSQDTTGGKKRRKSTKRKSTKRKSTKRKGTKRKATKKRKGRK